MKLIEFNFNLILLILSEFFNQVLIFYIFSKKYEAALLIDGICFFSKRINSLIGSNMSRLFNMENISLRRAEIYVNINKGINCSYDVRKRNKWILGNFVINQLIQKSIEVIFFQI